jgi:hypothetical protein
MTIDIAWRYASARRPKTWIRSLLFAMAADGNHLRPRGRRTHAYANEDEDTRFIARR